MLLPVLLLIVQAYIAAGGNISLDIPRQVPFFEYFEDQSPGAEERSANNDRSKVLEYPLLDDSSEQVIVHVDDKDENSGRTVKDITFGEEHRNGVSRLSANVSSNSTDLELADCKTCEKSQKNTDNKIASFEEAIPAPPSIQNDVQEKTVTPKSVTDSAIRNSDQREKVRESLREKSRPTESSHKNKNLPEHASGVITVSHSHRINETSNLDLYMKDMKWILNDHLPPFNDSHIDEFWGEHSSVTNKIKIGNAFDVNIHKKTTSTESPLRVKKKQVTKDFFDRNIAVSSVFTTPDGHMNDPPFRGPNISPDVDLKGQEMEHSKKEKELHSIDEPHKFYPVHLEMDWKRAKLQWGYAWECHCYIIGALFVAVLLYSLVSLLRVQTFMKIFSDGYVATINTFIFIMCFSRAFCMFYDPYYSNGKLSVVLSYVAFDILYPCTTSAYAVLFLSILQATNTQFLPVKFQKPYLLAPFVAFYFSLTITCDIIVGVFIAPTKLLLVCQTAFLGLSVVLTLSYFYIFKRVYYAALRKQGEIMRITFTKMHITGSNLPKKLPKPTLSLAVKLTLATSILQLLLCSLLVYGTFYAQFAFSVVSRTDPWLWWCYQLLCRMLELSICATMSFTTAQPLNRFELNGKKFCDIVKWFPCGKVTKCWKQGETVDFEDHSDNYANLQGFRNYEFRASPKRFHTNSLPTFRTPLYDVDNTLPMRNLPHVGRSRNTNHPSVLSLLSYYRSKRSISLSANDRLNDLDRTNAEVGPVCTLSIQRSHGSRPPSMLYKDHGFIRFRTDNDPEQPMEMTDEDDDTTSAGDVDSTKVDVGSSFCSLLEDEMAQSNSPQFFHPGFNRRARKLSRISVDTTDNSIDLSSDQLSNIVTFKNSYPNGGIDFSSRKYGSTCSSESAANSFDVTFFLSGNISPVAPSNSATTTPGSAADGSASRSETEDDKTSSVEGHENFLRSISPIVKNAAAKRIHSLPLKLDLPKTSESCDHGCHVNTACGTEDIAPDSAVYLDMQLSREAAPTSNDCCQENKFRTGALSSLTPPLTSLTDSSTPSNETSSSSSLHVTDTTKQASPTATSQSLDDLRTSNSYVIVSGARKTSGGFLNKLRGSAFSLNATSNGYEPLELKDDTHYQRAQNGKKLRRALSDRKPGYELPQQKLQSAEFIKSAPLTSMAHLGDSGLLDDCQEQILTLSDVASQTE